MAAEHLDAQSLQDGFVGHAHGLSVFDQRSCFIGTAVPRAEGRRVFWPYWTPIDWGRSSRSASHTLMID